MAQAENIIAIIEKLENPNVNIDQAKCLKVRNRNVSCSRCVDVCPASCISIQNNKVSFDAASCLGCLSCTAVCPTGALTGKRVNDGLLLNQAKAAMEATPGQAVFACERMMAQVQGMIKAGSAVQVKCLCSVDTTLLVQLASFGAREISLVTGDCDNCPLSSCMALTHHTAETANTLLETWNADSKVKVTAKLPSSTRKTESLGYDESRRGFFSDIRKESKNVAVDAGSAMVENAIGTVQESIISKLKVNASGVLPLIPNPRRTRLLTALDSFGTPQDEMISTDLWSQVVIDLEKCRACQVCATFCPSGALFKFHTESGKIGVKQAVRDCLGCHTCKDVCLHGALELHSEVFACDIAEGTVERYEMEQKKKGSKFTYNL